MLRKGAASLDEHRSWNSDAIVTQEAWFRGQRIQRKNGVGHTPHERILRQLEHEVVQQLSQIAGFVGAVIVAIAYLPQILHLARQHCSAGVSLGAWLLWLLGGVLILSHAIRIADGVFVTLQIVSIVAIVVVLVLGKRYQGMTCPLHGGRSRSR